MTTLASARTYEWRQDAARVTLAASTLFRERCRNGGH